MRFHPKFSELRVTTKLMLLNLLTWAAFLLIIAVIVSSFAIVRNMLTTVANRDMERVIYNSRTTRELSTVFDNIDILSRTFYGKKDYLTSEGDRLVTTIDKISENTLDTDIKTSLLTLSDTLDSFLSRCVMVNTALHAIESIERETDTKLTAFEDMIGDLLVTLTLEGEDTSFAEQLLTLGIGYRESLLQIGKLRVELGYEHYFLPMDNQTSPIIAIIDDLILRLQTVTASSPKVARHGEKILNNVGKYRAAVLTFYKEMEGLGLQLKSLNHHRALAMSVMESIDTRISSAAQHTIHSIEKIMLSSGTASVVLSILVVISMGFVGAHLTRTDIKNPMMAVLKGLESFGKGNFATRINLNRKDEWHTFETAFNHMAADLVTSYTNLQKANDELEMRVEKRTADLAKTTEELKKHRDHLEEMVNMRTRELKAAQENLIRKERLSALGQLTATVAHEIRNPLGTVRTSVFIIGETINRNEKKQVSRALQLAERNIRRCDGIITELLNFTRKKELKKIPMDIDAWLKELLDGQECLKEIQYKLKMTSGTVIAFDPEYLRRAVINVVTNAVQALKEEESSGKELTVKTTISGNRLEIRITDTGPGIPDDIKEKIFDLLFTTKSFGVGLGLAIVEEIMAEHGGGIEIESRPGKGTQVVLWLPVN